MTVKKYQQGLFALLLATLAWQSGAMQRQSLASIEMQVEAFIADYPYSSPYPATATLSTLDRRLQLNQCASPLDISFSHQGKTYGKTSVTIKCPGPVSWKLHLPVNIELFDDVVATTRPLVRGQGVKTTDTVIARRNVTRLQQGYFRERQLLGDLQATRNIKAGAILSNANLEPRTLVKSGQRVTLLLNLRGLKIKTTGLALQSGREGQTIKVRNIRSQRVVEGIIAGQGQVRVSL